MKKLFTIAMITIALAMAVTSCNKKKSDKFYMGLVSFVEGSWATGNFYVRFDNGETAYVTNTTSFTFKPALDGESRVIIYYTIEDQTATGFDRVITLSAAYGVPTDPVRDIYDHDFGEPSSYPNGVDIGEGYFAQNYISLQIAFKWSQSNNANHAVALVHNTKENHEGEFQSLYNDDGYLYLELYHNANNDSEMYDYASYVCYKVKPEKLNISLEDYSGIKILHKSTAGVKSTYTIKFQK